LEYQTVCFALKSPGISRTKAARNNGAVHEEKIGKARQVQEDIARCKAMTSKWISFHAKDDAKASRSMDGFTRQQRASKQENKRGNLGHPVAVNRDKYMFNKLQQDA